MALGTLKQLLQLQPSPSARELQEALAGELPQWRRNWRAAIPTLTLARARLGSVCTLQSFYSVYSRAARLHLQMTKQHLQCMHGLLRKWMSRSNYAKPAMKVLELMSAAGVTMTAIHVSMVVKACETSQLWQSAVDLLSKSMQDSVQADAVSYNACISACKAAAQWQAALQLLLDISKNMLQCSERSYSAAISACEKAGQWENALSILQLMKRRQGNFDAFSCTAAISACGSAARWEMACRLLRLMGEQRLSTVEAAFNAVITACGKASAWQQALQILHFVCKLGSPSSITFNAASFSCGEAGKWQLSLALLSQMHAHARPDRASFNTAITACGRSAQWQRALELLCANDLDRVRLAAATAACDMAGQWESALTLLEVSIQKNMLSGPCFTSAISSFSSGGSWEIALWTFNRMCENSVQQEARSFGAVLNACIRGDAWEWTIELLRVMMARQLIPQGCHVGSVTSALEEAKGKNVAYEFLDRCRGMWGLDTLPNRDEDGDMITAAAAVSKLTEEVPGLEALATGCRLLAVAKPAGQVAATTSL